jgi:UDP-2-acetamido-2-deoxy-ribo-hexuluronate aminotransferase
MITLSGFGYEQKLKSPSKAFDNTFKNKSFINGPAIKEFEQKFKEYVGAEDCVAVSSCTSALQLSLLALRIGPGDEVITVPYTWISTVEAIKQVGAKPVFVDINLNDLCMNVTDVGKMINSKTKAIIPVDLYGNVADIDELKKYSIPIIQDSAQSTGAIYKGKRVGNLSHLTCFSFYPTKNLGCWGDAGAVTGDARYCAEIRELRNHGQTKKFNVNKVGWNARMDTIQAEVLLNKLPLLDKHNKRRREIAFMYNEALGDLVTVPSQNKNSIHVFHQYVIQSIHRDRIQQALADKEIQSRAYYPVPLNELKPYRTEQKFPNSRYASLTGLAIPVHQYLTDKEVKLIIKTIKEAL